MENEKALSGVFYIDGSCRPKNPGFIGWGLFGYIYDNNSVVTGSPELYNGFYATNCGYRKQTTYDSDLAKSIASNTKLSYKLVNIIEYKEGFGSSLTIESNNVAEIRALNNLLISFNETNLKNITVLTDSEYLRNAMTSWCKNWSRNGWLKQDGTPVNNKELLRSTYNMINKCKDGGCEFKIHWVRSHDGEIGNERADMLAGVGMNYSRDGEYVNQMSTFAPKKFWESKIERNPLLAFRRLFFNTITDHYTPGTYYIGDANEPEHLNGKASSTTAFSIVKLHEPDPVIETVRKEQFKHSNGTNAFCLMRLDTLFGKNVYPWLKNYGKHSIVGRHNTHSLTLINEFPVTIEQNPSGLIMRCVEAFGVLETLLESFIDSVSQGNMSFEFSGNNVSVTDVTDGFYEFTTDKKGKEKPVFKSDFSVGHKDVTVTIPVNGKETNIPLLFGLDVLSRNSMKRIEETYPKVYVLHYVVGTTLFYHSILNCSIGIGIWSNYYANRIVFKK